MQSVDGTLWPGFLRCTREAEANVVITITGPPVITVIRAQILRIVVPATATDNAIGAS
jgi:hypothetical protein